MLVEFYDEMFLVMFPKLYLLQTLTRAMVCIVCIDSVFGNCYVAIPCLRP